MPTARPPSDLLPLIRERWPASMLSLVEASGEIARDLGVKLHVVGGAVRDLLLGRPTLDLDLVVEGNAVEVVRRLAAGLDARLVVHSRFGTAKLYSEGWVLDVVTARREEYPRPGALPVVQPGNLTDDLFRRDFTINALAFKVEPGPLGELVDPHGGLKDLEARLIRVLHPGSFVDDATRILRAVRYEQRLEFCLEERTAELMRRDVAMLDTISADRLRRELELILREPYPEKVLWRLEDVGALSRLLTWGLDEGLEARFGLARQVGPSPTLYLCLLAYLQEPTWLERFIARLRFPAKTAQAMRDTLEVKKKLPLLARAERTSGIYRLLGGHSPTAILANALVGGSSQVQEKLRLYLDKLRYVKVSLKGSDLMEMGLAPGPRLGGLLDRLLAAKLDGEAPTRDDEAGLVREWLAELETS
ncbi:MAG: CCA tRNA nucleotidyltransferase [Chloroflexi bacterium]|nr:CCA tRNA nucleotidyltransferase [Chloroflexota bacterium]